MAASASTQKKASSLLKEGRVRMEQTGGRSIYFSVMGETAERQVVFTPTKREWSCDCTYSTLNPGADCSHIIACRTLLREETSRRSPGKVLP